METLLCICTVIGIVVLTTVNNYLSFKLYCLILLIGQFLAWIIQSRIQLKKNV